VAGRVGLPVADVAVELGEPPGRDEVHVAQPVRDAVADVLRTLDVAVNDDREQPAAGVAGIVPAFELDRLRQLGVLALRQGRVGIAAVGADQPGMCGLLRLFA
jgi:hypothetical protein